MENRALRQVRGFMLDLDGVFYWDKMPLPGGERIVRLFDETGTPFLLFTNNATRTPKQYQDKLAEIGVHVGTERILTSSLATAAYLTETLPFGSKVFVIGQDGLLEALEEKGFRTTHTELDVAAVVVGLDTTLTFEKLKRATLAIRGGARFIATNADRTFPSAEGIILGNGAIVAAVETGSEQKAQVVGKPEQPIFHFALQRLNLPAGQAAMVGDRLDTDILGANRAGIVSVLVMCGLTSAAQLAASEVRAGLVCRDLDELADLWSAELERRRVEG